MRLALRKDAFWSDKNVAPNNTRSLRHTKQHGHEGGIMSAACLLPLSRFHHPSLLPVGIVAFFYFEELALLSRSLHGELVSQMCRNGDALRYAWTPETCTRKAKIVLELQLLHPQVDDEFHSDPKVGDDIFGQSRVGRTFTCSSLIMLQRQIAHAPSGEGFVSLPNLL